MIFDTKVHLVLFYVFAYHPYKIHFLYTVFAPLSFLVVDVYQGYGGPCKAMEAKFRGIKNTLGDPLLFFVVVSPPKRICFAY